MGSETIETSFLSIFALVSFFIYLIFSKYSDKIKNGALLDEDFLKPQAFHRLPVSRSGGIGGIISIIILIGIYYLLYSNFLIDYFLICISMFFVGFLDDIKINLRPSIRLTLMISLLFGFVYFLQIKIMNVDILFLSTFLKNDLLSALFVTLCFLFIINGSNLIDGFNGLLTINLIIINIILTYINTKSGNSEIAFFLIAQIIILLSFLLFNFPKAKIFLGDSGAYLMGSLVALNSIITNNLNPNVSSFFYCIVLFYLFVEVFFSFIRKVYQKKSPIYPDEYHLHMLSFKIIAKKYGRENGNFINSIIINLSYLLLIIPGFYFSENPSLSRYWFFLLIFIYMYIYSRLYRLTKNQIVI